jgi:tetratricopeptide (TPR) repeat protein
MRKTTLVICLLAVVIGVGLRMKHVSAAGPDSSNHPAYTSDGKLVLPANYRDWTFLTTGLGMNYSTGTSSNPMFTNVFVNPEAYRAFKETGKWPDKSTWIVEIYSPATHGSINKGGHYQDTFMGLDIEVKDSSRPNEWAYYNLDRGETSASETAGRCNSCHEKNAAVEHTFVQFYPTLLDFAMEKNLIKPGVSIPLNRSRFVALVSRDGVPKAEQAFYEDRKKNPESDLLGEMGLLRAAADLYEQKKIEQSLQVVMLATKAYPSSPRPYDWLGQAYQEMSKPQQAVEASQKELALLDKDSTLSSGEKKQFREDAEKRIAQLNKK